MRKFHGNKKFNEYIFSDEIGIGYTSKGEEFYFDLDDYDLIKYHCWSVGGGGRLVARNPEGGTPIKFHRLVMGFPDLSMDIDHINRNQLDNRKSNLRICTHKNNIRNIKIPKNNTTGFIGVSFRKDIGKYESYLEMNGRKRRLGSYKNIEDAVVARLRAEKKYFGEYSPQRILFEKYNI